MDTEEKVETKVFSGNISADTIAKISNLVADALEKNGFKEPTPELVFALFWLAIGQMGKERPTKEEHIKRFLAVLHTLDVKIKDISSN
jgi:hypothetical protein